MNDLTGINLTEIVKEKAKEISKETVDILGESKYYTPHELAELIEHSFIAGSKFTIKQLRE
jgi:hypothetical protein